MISVFKSLKAADVRTEKLPETEGYEYPPTWLLAYDEGKSKHPLSQ